MFETHDDVFHGFSECDADVDGHDAEFAVFDGVVRFVTRDVEGVVLDFSGEVACGPEFAEEVGEHAFDAIAQFFSVDFEDDPLRVFVDGASDGVEDASRHEVSPFWCVGECARAPWSDAALWCVANAVDAFVVEFGVLAFVHGCVDAAEAFDGDVGGSTEDAVVSVASCVDAGHESRGWDGFWIAFVVEHDEPRIIQRSE